MKGALKDSLEDPRHMSLHEIPKLIDDHRKKREDFAFTGIGNVASIVSKDRVKQRRNELSRHALGIFRLFNKHLDEAKRHLRRKYQGSARNDRVMMRGEEGRGIGGEVTAKRRKTSRRWGIYLFDGAHELHVRSFGRVRASGRDAGRYELRIHSVDVKHRLVDEDQLGHVGLPKSLLDC